MQGGASVIKTVGSKSEVYKGKAKHTAGGLTKDDILRVSAGKRDGKSVYRYVSKKKHTKALKNTPIKKWAELVSAVRKHYNIKLGDAMKKASQLKKSQGIATAEAFKAYIKK